jgi:hypothetical protein
MLHAQSGVLSPAKQDAPRFEISIVSGERQHPIPGIALDTDKW